MREEMPRCKGWNGAQQRQFHVQHWLARFQRPLEFHGRFFMPAGNDSLQRTADELARSDSMPHGQNVVYPQVAQPAVEQRQSDRGVLIEQLQFRQLLANLSGKRSFDGARTHDKVRSHKIPNTNEGKLRGSLCLTAGTVATRLERTVL